MTGHALPYTMVPGEEPVLAASFRGSAEQVLWSADGGRLLVRAADPGSYGHGLVGSAGDRRRAAIPIRSCAGPGTHGGACS